VALDVMVAGNAASIAATDAASTAHPTPFPP